MPCLALWLAYHRDNALPGIVWLGRAFRRSHKVRFTEWAGMGGPWEYHIA